MDIRIVLRRFLTYLFLAGFTYIIFYLVIYIENRLFNSVYTTGAYLIGILLAFIFVAIFYPLQKLMQKATSKFLFSDLYNYQKTLTNLSDKLTTMINLDQIIDLVVETIKDTMQLDRSGVLLVDTSKPTPQYKIARVSGFNEQNGISLVQDNFLTKHLEKYQKPLVKEELDFLSESAVKLEYKKGFLELKKHMTKIEASLALPLISNNKLIGIIVLGSKFSGDAYTKEDLELLNVLANQAAIAIANARLYHEVQDFNKNLSQKVEEQTKDITEKTRRLEKLLKMRSEFLDIASHQLRTPVSVINGTLSMMMEGDFEKLPLAKQQEFISNIYHKGQKLCAIIDDILSASEMDTTKFTISDFAEVEMCSFLEEIAREKKIDAQQKNLVLVFVCGKNQAIKVRANERYLEQAVINLIDNAIKYTLKGKIEVGVKEQLAGVLLYVKDEGIGVPEKDLPKLFNKFIRAKNAREVYTDGSGLGLFIVKQIVEGHNGKVWVKSQENKGSIFNIWLPTNNP